MGELLQVGINLSELPKEKISTDRNGKKWLNFSISERRDPSQYGDTHSVYIYDPMTKEKIYIGNARRWQPQTAAKPENPVSDDDLPF